MSKARRRQGLIAVCAVSLAGGGCAGILGDFESTPAGAGGDDGGNGHDTGNNTADGTSEGSSGDDGSTGDGPAVVDGSDAGDAADGNIPTLTCLEQGGGNRVKLASLNKSNSNDKSAVRLFNTSVGGQTRYRAVVEESLSNGPSIFHVYTFSNGGGGSVTDTPIPQGGNGNGTLTIARYAGGIAALSPASVQNDGGGGQHTVLQILTLDDAASAWATAVTLPDTLLPGSCLNRLSGALYPFNAASNDFLVEVAYQPCGTGNPPGPPGPYQHSVTRTSTLTTKSWPLPPEKQQGDAGAVDSGALGFDPSGITVSGTSVFSMTNPNGNNGPSPGIGAATFSAPVSLASQPTTRDLPLADPVDIMQGLSITTLPNGDIGFAILEANLSSQTVTPIIYAGSVPTSKISTLAPSTDLRATTLGSIGDLPINGASYHWESFSSPFPSDNLLAVGAVFPSNSGMNFIWFNGKGDVRSKRTGGNSFFYFDIGANPNGLLVYGGDVTFDSAPFGAIAGLEMVFVQADSEASTLVDVWATKIQCSP